MTTQTNDISREQALGRAETGEGAAPRRRLWLEGWLPDRLTPANDSRWEPMEYWRPRT